MPTTSLIIQAGAGEAARRQWDNTIRNLFGAVDVAIPNQPGFAGQIRSSRLGSVDLSQVRSTCEDAQRTARHVAQDTDRSYILSFVDHGTLHLEQRERSCDVGPGTFVLFDVGLPYRYRHPAWSQILSLKIPGALLQGRIQQIDRHLVIAGRAHQGIGRVTKDALAALALEADRIPELVGAAYATKMVDLVAILLEAGHGDLPLGNALVRSTLFRRIALYIDSHLSNPDLSPAIIAGVFGISLRYLHKIFQEQDTSVGDLVRSRRLARCYDDLAQPGPHRTSIKDIALRSGFRSQAHFASSFRREYQMSPSDVRRLNPPPRRPV